MSHEDWDDVMPSAVPEVSSGKSVLQIAVQDRWEESQPVDKGFIPQATGRFPQSEEAERHVLACILLEGEYGDDGNVLKKALARKLSAEHFYSPRNRLVFQLCRKLVDRKVIPSTLTLVEELKATRQLEAVGGMMYVMDMTSNISTTSHVDYFITRLLQDRANREEIRRAKEIVERADRGEDVGIIQERSEGVKPRPITSYAYPSDDDPNTLLGNDDYLGRGGGMLFVSHAGAGKSSWIMDACMMWAIGRPWMGIKCNGPLKSIIIQAEDSDRYIGKIFSSFAHVNQLTPEQLALLTKNCIIIRLKGVSGPAFEAELERLVQDHVPDLVIVNPVYLYAYGDISRSEFAQPFLVGLDRVNKAEKFAYILIHHTGKPAKKDGKKAELDDWESAYMGFGSSYFANWPRCTALLEPVSGQNGRFQIKLGKGGLNAGITKQVPQGAGTRPEPVTRINIKHSTDRMDVSGKSKPVYYWEMDTEIREEEDDSKKGRPKKYTLSQISAHIPQEKSKAINRKALLRYASELTGMSDSALRDLLDDAIQSGEVIRTGSPGGGFGYYLNVPGQ